jgi:hypothetical protein
MATLQQAIEYAKQNPDDPRSVKLRESIQSGMMDNTARNEGVDLSGVSPSFSQVQKKSSSIYGDDVIVPEGVEPIAKPENRFIKGVKETVKDIADTGRGLKNVFTQTKEDVGEIATDDDRFAIEKVVNIGGELYGGGAEAVGEVVKGAVKTVLPESGEEVVRGGLQKFGETVAETELAQDINNWYNELSPSVQRNVDSAMGYGVGVLELLGLRGAGGLTKKGATEVTKYLNKVDDVVKRIDDPTEEAIEKAVKEVDTPKLVADDFADPKLREQAIIRAEAEAVAPKITLKEKAIGLTPDDKAQIIGKTDKLQDYIDVASTRNVTKEAPSVQEFAGNQARRATEEMEKVLNDTGSRIGQTRQKYATVQAPIDEVTKIEDTFRGQLDDLNLELNARGEVVQKAGAVSRTRGGDIREMQSLWNEFQRVKQSPTLTNLIDYRNLVQENIKFGKSAREVSDALNTPSTNIRRSVKEVSDNIVGKEGVADLDEYTRFIEAYNDIKKFTDRKAGGEYMLRVLESGRGGEARQVINTIKANTGIDLQDDATMMRLVLNEIANETQKNLFRQEVSRAGFDAVRVLGGDASPVFGRIGEAVVDRFTDPESILIEATKVAN